MCGQGGFICGQNGLLCAQDAASADRTDLLVDTIRTRFVGLDSADPVIDWKSVNGVGATYTVILSRRSEQALARDQVIDQPQHVVYI